MAKEKPRGDIINHSEAADYVTPTDPLLLSRLEWFQDQKLALMVHWGGYSQWGICESWPLSDADASWSRRDVDWESDPARFRQQYFALNRTFHPVRFQPEAWARFAKDAGFRYLIFTTKHHDGFCMFDTQQTDYKVTAPDCPFHTHQYADIARHLFDAFRAQGLGIAAYFSKPDWHCPWYWAAGMDLPVGHWRNPTYDVREHPELWEQFVRFTHAQMMELVERYGRLEILWLDGGQVRPQNGQDIRLGELAARARAVQPWLLFADRTVGGPYENYITPEQTVPEEPLRVPWESCITIGTSFSYRYDDTYKSPRQLVHLLVDIVCKGGNLALNLGGMPDGRLPEPGMRAALGMGEWLKQNGETIYGTRICAPYRQGRFGFTRRGGERYAIYCLPEGECLPQTLLVPMRASGVRLVADGRPLACEAADGGTRVFLPADVAGSAPLALALCMGEGEF